jgi:hypothetical protein
MRLAGFVRIQLQLGVNHGRAGGIYGRQGTLVGSPEVTRCIEGVSHFVTSMTSPTTSG